jgi:glycosyltransferase involved in cell wall biosynthesis/PAS domain-containing protein
MATPKHIIRDRVIGAIAGVLIGFLGRVVAPEDPSWVVVASLFLGATWTMWRGRSAGLYAFIATIVGEALAARIIRERVGFVLEGAILAGLLVAGLTIITQIDILRRRARIAQRRAERLEDLNRNSVVGILDVSPEGTIVGANKSAAATFSLTPGHLIGRAHDDVGWDVVGTDGKLVDMHDLPGNYTMRHRVPSGFWGMVHSSKDDQWKPIWIGATPDSGSGGVQVMVASEDGHLTNLIEAVGIQEEAPTYRQLRVCYLDHTAKLSGGEIALARLLETIDRKAIDPWVILAEDGSLAERLRAIGIRVDIVPLSDTVLDVRKDSVQSGIFSKVGLILQVLAYGFKVAALIRTQPVDIIHTNSLKSDIYGMLVSRLCRVPLIWHIRDHIDVTYLPSFAVKMMRFLAARVPAFVIANSQSTLDQLHLAVAKPGAVVPSGVDPQGEVVYDGIASGIPPVASDTLMTGPLRIAIVGRLAGWKGQHIFLEAASKLVEAGIDAQFLIAGTAMFGEDSYVADLHSQVDRLGLQGKVQFLGHVDPIEAFLPTVSILVHASTSPEPFGQVVIEGMAAGIPVVATDGGGVKETVVHGETGLLVPMGNAQALADALRMLIDRPELRAKLSTKGRQRVLRHFTASITARKVERVYREVLTLSHSE